jgi:hypothetical protein
MRNHFRRVTELAIPVHAICGRKVFHDSVLSLVTPAEDKLALAVPGDVPAPAGVVAVSYSLDSYVYTFEAEALHVLADPSRSGTLITLNLPDRVARIERRRFRRVPCSGREPVVVRPCLRNGEPFAGTAIDVGLRGVSFLVPGDFTPLQVGDSFPILVVLPRLGELSLNAIARAVVRISDGLRVGVEFVDFSEEEAELIRQYVHLRQIQIDYERPSVRTPSPPRESIFVVAAKEPSGRRQFVLCTDAFLDHLADPDVFTEITSVEVIDYLKKN